MYVLELSVLAVYSDVPKDQCSLEIKLNECSIIQGLSLNIENWPVCIHNADSCSIIEILILCESWEGAVTIGVDELEICSNFTHKWIDFEFIYKDLTRKAEMLVSFKKTDGDKLFESKEVQITSLKAQLAETQASLAAICEITNTKRADSRIISSLAGLHSDEKLLIKVYELAKETESLRRSLTTSWKENAKKDSEIHRLKEELKAHTSEGMLNLSAIKPKLCQLFEDSMNEETMRIDDLLRKFLRERETSLLFTKLSENCYIFGGQRLTLKLQGEDLMAQVCGGTLSLSDFINVSSRLQTRRARQRSAEPLSERAINTIKPKIQLQTVATVSAKESYQRSLSNFKSPTSKLEPVLRKRSKIEKKWRN